MNLQNYNKNDYLITPSGIPGEWEGSDNQRRVSLLDVLQG